MKLMTKEIEKKIPALYTQDGKKGEAVIHVKFFTPWSDWTWYGLEYSKEDGLFFGLVQNKYGVEYGYFSLEELEEVKGPCGLKIERDMHFGTPKVKEVNLLSNLLKDLNSISI